MQFLFEEYVKVDFFAKDKREEFHCNLCKHSKLEFKNPKNFFIAISG
jgi:hypothetical protein